MCENCGINPATMNFSGFGDHAILEVCVSCHEALSEEE